MRFPGFEKIINTDVDRAGIFRNKKMIKERDKGKLRPDSRVNKAICASMQIIPKVGAVSGWVPKTPSGLKVGISHL